MRTCCKNTTRTLSGLSRHTSWRKAAVLVAALATLLAGAPARCGETALADSDGPRWKFAGYGTLGVVGDNQEQLAPIRDLSQRPEDSYETRTSARVDSRLALHLAVQAARRFDLVAQAVVRDQIDRSVGGAFELAYAEWRPGGNRKVRLGRVGYDAFLMSDHRNLGYTNLAVRPPTEFYGWIPLFSVDGIDLVQDWYVRDARWRARAQTGSYRTTLPIGREDFEFATRDLWTISLTRESGPWRIKVGFSRFSFDGEAAPLAPLHAALDRVAAEAPPAIATEARRLRAGVSFDGAFIRYRTLGVAYDDGNWTAQGEIGDTRTTTTIAPAARSAYLVVGRRFGEWTPYAMIAASRPERPPASAPVGWTAPPLSALGGASAFASNGTRVDQRTVSLGLRRELTERAALKAQWDRVEIAAEGYALWFRALELNDQPSRVNMGTLALDFVF